MVRKSSDEREGGQGMSGKHRYRINETNQEKEREIRKLGKRDKEMLFLRVE